MNTKTLEHLGLTAEQAQVYSTLITFGTLPARKISLETQIKRSLVYKILRQLIALGLVEEMSSPAVVTKFSALHPSQLEKLLNHKKADLDLAAAAMEQALGVLTSQYNLTHHKPNVRFYEGMAGLKALYQDILRTGADIRLIRSPLDNDTPERDKFIAEQIKKQVAKNIKARIISSRSANPQNVERDRVNLVTRCHAPKEQLEMTAQVLIYANKVALTSFDQFSITTIIEDEQIAKSFGAIFEALWEKFSGESVSTPA